MSKRILLICYSFPPHPGIGGRRWAKFVKYLLKKKFGLSVVNAQNIENQVSLWNDDIKSGEIDLFSHKFTFQKTLLSPSNIFQKLIRKVLVFFLKYTIYTPDMITSFPNKKMWKKVEEIIKEKQINQVIVTGDPYLFYYAAVLKQKLKFELLLDYRDLWNDHSYYNSFVTLSKKQQVFFEYAENYAINHCDKIICVDEGIKNTISKRLVTPKDIAVINNGFDKDEFLNLSTKEKSEKIKLIFAGGISSDNNILLSTFVDSFMKLRESNPELFNNIELHIVSSCDQSLEKKFNAIKSPNFIFTNKFLSRRNYLELLTEMDFGIVFISKEYTDSFATKFSDYLKLNIFSISLGYEGYFSNFITKHKLGIHFDIDNPDSDFFLKLASLSKEKIHIPNEMVYRFDLEHLTEKLISVLN